MLIKVKTYRPIRRLILIRFQIPVLSGCFLLIILFAASIWLNMSCNRDESVLVSIIPHKAYSLNEIQRIKEAKRCFRPTTEKFHDNVQPLEDILEAEKRPQPGQSIFFHETSCTTNGIIQVNARYIRTNVRKIELY